MYPYAPQYPMMPQPYPMQFPAPYAPQYPMYASNSPVIPVPDTNPIQYQSVLPGQSDQSRYGNLPVEIIDVSGPQGLPNQFNPYGMPISYNTQQQPRIPFLYVADKDSKYNQTEVMVDNAQSVLDVDNKYIKTESVVEAEPILSVKKIVI
ncbi:hypothetical protein CBL_01728 [Carabus blaptoides fortunei]